MNSQNQHTFSTHDLYIASMLKTAGLRLVEIRRDGGGRGVFIFEDNEQRPKLIMDFFNGELSQNIRAYIDNWTNLKMLVNQL